MGILQRISALETPLKVAAICVTLVGAGYSGFVFLSTPDVSGSWVMTDVITDTSCPQNEGMVLTFQVDITQDGKNITARGFKLDVNGAPIRTGEAAILEIDGTIQRRKLLATYTESVKSEPRGAGSFTWEIGSDKLDGTFWSDICASRGPSVLERKL